MESFLSWEALEYPHREHGKDWYWAVGIITIAIAATSVILKNFLFAILIIIAGFTLSVMAKRKPRMVHFTLDNRGLIIEKTFYPYNAFESFWIEETEMGAKILFKYNRAFVSHIVAPLENVDVGQIHTLLSRHLHEVEHYEPVTQKVMEYLGF